MPIATWAGLAMLIVAMAGVASCSDEPQVSPEQLIEQQPSGAGVATELESRPGYLKRSRLVE